MRNYVSPAQGRNRIFSTLSYQFGYSRLGYVVFRDQALAIATYAIGDLAARSSA